MNRKQRFEEIYNSNKNSIFRICYLYLKNYQLAEDATQEVFIKVYCKLNMFRNKSNINTWITRIAINLCKDKLKKKSNNEIANEQILCPKEHFSETVIENKIILVNEIMKLPLELREIIILYYYRELKQKDISQLLHIPETTVAYRLRKAKELLKTQIREDMFYE